MTLADQVEPSVPNGWRVVRFGDAYTFTRRPRGLDALSRPTIPFVPMDALPLGGVLATFAELAPPNMTSGNYFEEGDFLLARITPCFENGKQALTWHVPGGWGIATTEVFPIRSSDESATLAFLDFFLRDTSIRQSLSEKMEGATGRQRLRRDTLENLSISMPPADEQAAIALFLSTLQEATGVDHRRIATLKELKAATMAKLFREGLRGEPLKLTDIGEMPGSWTVRRLGDLCKVQSGGTPSRAEPKYWNGTIPWVKTGEINYRPITSTGEKITQKALDESAARVFPRGTLLMAMYGQGVTRGRVAFIEVDAATNQACAALMPDVGELSPGFLYAFSVHSYSRIRELGHGANQQNLSADIIRSIRLPVPPTLEEQEGIFATLQVIEGRIRITEDRLDALAALFRSALHQLMTGQLRVTPLLAHRLDAHA